MTALWFAGAYVSALALPYQSGTWAWLTLVSLSVCVAAVLRRV